MSRALSHSDYYRDRRSEDELCCDFPGDAILIDGLHAMQTHFMHRGMACEIPVVRVMNTAHWLACYMFNTTCSGDQQEYDALSYNSVGRDKQLAVIALIVLAAMLKRTEGMRARSCRSLLLEDRSEDFYDGVSLYEQFIGSGEAHFAQEDFETDVMDEVVTLREQNAQLVQQVLTLQTTIKTMENETRHIGYNVEHMTINMSGGTLVQHADLVQASGEVKVEREDRLEVSEKKNFFCRITEEAYEKGQAKAVEEELRRACVSAPKLIKAIRTNEALGYLDTQDLSSKELYDLLNEHFTLPFTSHNFTVYRSKPIDIH